LQSLLCSSEQVQWKGYRRTRGRNGGSTDSEGTKTPEGTSHVPVAGHHPHVRGAYFIKNFNSIPGVFQGRKGPSLPKDPVARYPSQNQLAAHDVRLADTAPPTTPAHDDDRHVELAGRACTAFDTPGQGSA
jgi:hypothetical protein